jgi:hypothetical protein
MKNGSISGNVTDGKGGGVYIDGSILGLILGGTFNLNPPATIGSISGNTPNQVYNDGGTFKVNSVTTGRY